MTEYSDRRKKLAQQMQNNSVALLHAGHNQMRTSSAQHMFRTNNDFYYLTGFKEPEAVLALIKDNNGKLSYVLFSTAIDPVTAIWDGEKIGQERAKKIYLADEAYDLATIDVELPKLLAGRDVIYYPLGIDPKFDKQILKWLKLAKRHVHSKESKSVLKLPTLQDVLFMVHELRVFKSTQEIENMRKAAEISALAHLKLMQTKKVGLMEYQLEAIFNEHCLYNGCRAPAYNPIVAGGNNACTLHYIDNSQKLKDGDLVLVDAAGEYDHYAADITRTFPVNGKFTSPQKQIYELVLKAQLAGIAAVQPGNKFEAVQDVMVPIITQGLHDLGILKGDVKQLIKEGAYKKYYMHSSGHWLGLEVHDPGLYRTGSESRIFEPGMVLTVEPGIYISSDAEVASQWRGIGVRIEDDILVTKGGNEVLSNKVPKTIAEIESAAS